MTRRKTLSHLGLAVLGALAVSGTASAQIHGPEWLEREREQWAGRREPQIPDAERAFRAARPLDAERLEGAVLLCFVLASEPSEDSRTMMLRGSAPRRWDLFADPDLRIIVSAGARRSVIWGNENSRGHYFSVPAVSLRRGQRLSLAVADRDVTTMEPIGRIDARYEGRLPIALSARYLEGECRAASAELTGARLAAAMERATRSIELVERAAPSLERPDLGRPRAAAAEARPALLEAAAWAGWRDAGVRGARTRFEAAERGFDRRLREAVAEAHRAAPRVGEAVTVGGGEARVRAFTCGARARALAAIEDRSRDVCVAQLEVSATDDAAPAWLGTPDLVDARGGVHGASEVRFVERVDAATVRVALVLPPRITARGAVLRVAGRLLRVA